MIKSLFDKEMQAKIMIAILLAIPLLLVYITIDYSNVFNDQNGVMKYILYDKETRLNSMFISLFVPLIGMLLLFFILLIPILVKNRSKRYLMCVISIVVLSVTYLTAIKITASDYYILSKKESFLKDISTFYSQYAETDGGKEVIFYLDKNDYNSIGKIDRKKLKYADLLSVTNLVNQVNDQGLKKEYDNSMLDGQISLLEKEKLDTIILQKTNEKI